MLTWFLILQHYFDIDFRSTSLRGRDAYAEWTLEAFFDIDEARSRPGVDFASNINTFNFNDSAFADAMLNDGFAESPLRHAVKTSLERVLPFARQRAYANLYLGLNPAAQAWAEFARQHPVGDMELRHLKPVSDDLWQVHTPTLQIGLIS